MTVHVLLTADNHLDPSAVQYGPRRFERKRDFQHSFDVLVNFALENRPDLFLIGGDFYDGILAGQELSREGDVNIFLTHYPIEGFEGYFGQETHIGKSSIPRNYQLFASGHLHRHQKNTINGTTVMYPGSTERVSFNEEGEEKGFCWLELDKNGVLNQEFHTTPARPMETLDSRVTGEGGSLTRQVQDVLEKRRGAEKILRIRVTGRVSLDQLSTYKRSALQSYCQERFFHTEFDEDGLNVLTSEAIESLPRTTPLEELGRSFQSLLSNVKEEERPLVHEAWNATVARLQEEGVS